MILEEPGIDHAMISPELIKALKRKFALDWMGPHGVPHWARVRANGLRLAELSGARPRVVELFAFLHDSCRKREMGDPEHGPRAARFSAKLLGREIQLGGDDFNLLHEAISAHSDGLTQADITVMTCWDADRLDLGRVGIRPRTRYLCTEAAREPGIMQWAYERSLLGPDA
jgi:uncharacterized protein